jgi:hypothetical protein
MSSQESATRFPSNGNTGTGQRDSGHLAVSSSARWPDTEPALSRRMWRNEAVGKPRRKGCMRTSALASPKLGRPTEERPRFQTGPGKPGRPGL